MKPGHLALRSVLNLTLCPLLQWVLVGLLSTVAWQAVWELKLRDSVQAGAEGGVEKKDRQGLEAP